MMKAHNPLNGRRLAFLQLLLCGLCLGQINCGQTTPHPLDKTQALKDVKVSSVNGWKEMVLDKGRFRVLFPREPETEDNPAMHGYKLKSAETNWFAYYNDFEEPRTNDETKLRDAYHKSVEALTKKGSKLLKQVDVRLNGRLGSEFVLEGPGTVSYMRAFMIGRRLYTLVVDSKRAVNGDATIPQDVQQFFDSFTFWD
ncbi:MAG TPA: hypothetical protein VGO91_17375 [Pyrinomonadaceae bacterium]|jgi:hypothetical protein|nr:hypothetical protein [Pyrinomonadaceae bacterium]